LLALTADGVDADPESPMSQLLGSSITYRIAVGPQQGRKDSNAYSTSTLKPAANVVARSK